MNWKHGYYADSGYTYGYYAETMPVRLRWACLIQGHEAPATQFRYLDAGCGQGLNLILAAIAHPESEFVGIDFLPEHIAHARALAEQCGLSNVSFIEGDFVELSANPALLGEFDYAICHGITTWIAPTVKAGLFRLIGKVLKPGGVFYNSYNTFPGWLGVVPFQHLVLLEQRSKTGALALAGAHKSMDILRQHSPGMFAALPGLDARVKSMEAQDPAYLVQEYNNQFWQPVFVTQMMDDLADVKLNYLGTATIPEAYDALLPLPVQELLQQQPTSTLKEQLRDYATNQNFRRDLYVKGVRRPWAAAQTTLVKSCRFVVNPMSTRPAAGQPYPIKGGSIQLNGDPTFYSSLLDSLGSHPLGLTLGELMDAQSNAQQRNSVVQAVSLLLHADYIHLTKDDLPASLHPYRLAATAIAARAYEGAPYKFTPLPAIGGAIPINDTEWVMLHEHLTGVPDNQWGARIKSNLKELGRALAKDGKPVTDPNQQDTMLKKAISDFCKQKLPYLQRMGGA